MSRVKDVAGGVKELRGRAKENAVLKEFKEFINRGSVMDLAVGMVIGAAFTAIVTSLVNDIIMPVVGLVAGGVDFTGLKWTIPNFFGAETAAVISYGSFIQAVVDFLIIAFAIFMFIKLLNRLQKKAKEEEAAAEKKEAKQEDEQTKLLREIRDAVAGKPAKKTGGKTTKK